MHSEFTKPLFDTVRQKISDYCGIFLGDEQQNELAKKVADRMERVGVFRYPQYVALLSGEEGGPEELRRLSELITNNETYFFREPGHFQALRSFVIPELLRRKREKRIRIWSAGCSTGEEVYTLAMVLHEARLVHGPFDARVIGTDIDRQALQAAQRGQYGRNSFRSIENHYLKTYFAASGPDRRKVDDRLRPLVQFEWHNLFDERGGNALRDIDVIFFRNVSIYFAREKIRLINERLSQILNDQGFLFLGSSETLHHNFGNLQLVEVGDVFLYRKTAGGNGTSPERRSPAAPSADAHVPKPRARKRHAVPATAGLAEPEPEPITFDLIFARYREGLYAECGKLIERYLASPRLHAAETVQLLLLRAHLHIAQERLDEARADCRRVLELDNVNAEAYFLNGLIAYYRSRWNEASESFRKALFLRPGLSLAHFHLALVCRQEGMAEDARREFRNTIRVLEQRMDASLSFAALGYSSAYLINSCKQQLKAIG
jgi:chemotaxis protein methyltransferase CheR